MHRVREVETGTTNRPAAQATPIHDNHEVMTVRKLALLFAGGALWLFVAALPVLADGGPHQMAVNNGTGGLTADTCAGCHRAHTATAEGLLNNDLPELCLDCHNGTKATTDVLHGVQYNPDGTGAVLGALRGGGFVTARIDSANGARVSYLSGTNVRNIGHVQPLAAGVAVTSTHGGTGGILSAGWGNGTVWGNGGVTNGVGPTVALNCASCHNPHGNGQYRILQTKSSVTVSSGAFALTDTGGVEVQDTPYTGVRNYTIRPSSNGLASGVVAGTSGDYWRYHWDPTGALNWALTTGGPPADPMNTGWQSLTDTYVSTNATTGVQTTNYVVRYPVNAAEIPAYNAQLAAYGTTDPVTKATSITTLDNRGGLMTAWCIQCHSRYNGNSVVQGTDPTSTLGVSSLYDNSGGDSVFMYKHGTTRIGCEQCHVSHGSNAAMTGSNSFAYEDPSGAVPPSVGASGDSRLLKADNRGTCQLCHDPTGTITAGTYIGPASTPGN
jgi:predicted CXXCH cytochrome family protein